MGNRRRNSLRRWLKKFPEHASGNLMSSSREAPGVMYRGSDQYTFDNRYGMSQSSSSSFSMNYERNSRGASYWESTNESNERRSNNDNEDAVYTMRNYDAPEDAHAWSNNDGRHADNKNYLQRSNLGHARDNSRGGNYDDVMLFENNNSSTTIRSNNNQSDDNFLYNCIEHAVGNYFSCMMDNINGNDLELGNNVSKRTMNNKQKSSSAHTIAPTNKNKNKNKKGKTKDMKHLQRRLNAKTEYIKEKLLRAAGEVLPIKEGESKANPEKYWREWWPKYAYIEKSIKDFTDDELNTVEKSFECTHKPPDDEFDELKNRLLRLGVNKINRNLNISECNYERRDVIKLFIYRKKLSDPNFQQHLNRTDLQCVQKTLKSVNKKVKLALLLQSMIYKFHRYTDTLKRIENGEDIPGNHARNSLDDEVFHYFVLESIKELKTICQNEWSGFEEFYKETMRNQLTSNFPGYHNDGNETKHIQSKGYISYNYLSHKLEVENGLNTVHQSSSNDPPFSCYTNREQLRDNEMIIQRISDPINVNAFESGKSQKRVHFADEILPQNGMEFGSRFGNFGFCDKSSSEPKLYGNHQEHMEVFRSDNSFIPSNSNDLRDDFRSSQYENMRYAEEHRYRRTSSPRRTDNNIAVGDPKELRSETKSREYENRRYSKEHRYRRSSSPRRDAGRLHNFQTLPRANDKSEREFLYKSRGIQIEKLDDGFVCVKNPDYFPDSSSDDERTSRNHDEERVYSRHDLSRIMRTPSRERSPLRRNTHRESRSPSYNRISSSIYRDDTIFRTNQNQDRYREMSNDYRHENNYDTINGTYDKDHSKYRYLENKFPRRHSMDSDTRNSSEFNEIQANRLNDTSNNTCWFFGTAQPVALSGPTSFTSEARKQKCLRTKLNVKENNVKANVIASIKRPEPGKTKHDPENYWKKWWPKYAYIERVIEKVDPNDEAVVKHLKFNYNTEKSTLEAQVIKVYETGFDKIKQISDLNEINYDRRVDGYDLLKYKILLEDRGFQRHLFSAARQRLNRNINRLNKKKIKLTLLYQNVVNRWHKSYNFAKPKKEIARNVKKYANYLQGLPLFKYLVYLSIQELKKTAANDWPGFIGFYNSLK